MAPLILTNDLQLPSIETFEIGGGGGPVHSLQLEGNIDTGFLKLEEDIDVGLLELEDNI